MDWKEASRTEDLREKIQFNPDHMDSIEKFFNAPKRNRITLIHSVRGANAEEPQYLKDFLKDSESKGNQVYIPKIFNFQKDETGGVVICNTMRYVIENSKTVAVGYNPDSEGSKFDLGMALYFGKNLNLINPDEIFDDEVYRALKTNFSHTWGMNLAESVLMHYGMDLWEKDITKENPFPISLGYSQNPKGNNYTPVLNMVSALVLGMAYASRRPFKIVNREEVEKQSAMENQSGVFKSYSKVALKMSVN